MDYRSKLGYSKVSPFNKERANTINADGIDMRNTSKPLLALHRKGASMLSPGGYYPGIKGRATEMPVETLLELEPMLLELHLSKLKGDQKEEFMDKYGVLGTNMKVAALSQILAKHPEVGQQVAQIQMQNGGSPQPQFLGDLPSYAPESRSTLETRPQPVQGINYNAMFLDFALPLTNEAQRLDKQGRYGEASALRTDVMTANQFRQDMESGTKMKTGGKAHALTPQKAKEILHDGTVHGKPITEKQRKFFGAIASGSKRIQDGGGIEIKESHKGRFTETAHRHGMDVQDFAAHVLSNKGDYSKSIVKQANFARNAASWNQSGGKSWHYQAPPMEGMVLTGIESNRPVKESLPPQGISRRLSKQNSRPAANTTSSTAEEEAFWSKLRAVNALRAQPENNSAQVSGTSASIVNFVGKEATALLGKLPRTWAATDIQRNDGMYDHRQVPVKLMTEEALANRYRPQADFIPLLTEEALLQKKLNLSPYRATVK